jgi:hypothetical protein
VETIIAAIQKTPLPTILILAGLLFVLLGFVTRIGGILEVSTGPKTVGNPHWIVSSNCRVTVDVYPL